MSEMSVSEGTKRDVNRRCCGALAAAWCAAAVFVAAAAPEYHDWTAQEGYADAPASWSGSTLPTSTQAPRFTGAGSSYTVKFPAGGYTIPGNFVTVRELADGSVVTFDATEGDWLHKSSSYLSTSWQSFMVCANAINAGTWPHIMNVINSTNGKPIFRLSGGRVRFTRNAADGSELELLGGTWNFYDPEGTANGTQGLALLNAIAADAKSRVVFSGGTLRAANLNVDCGTPNSRVVFSGGDHHIYASLCVARNDPGSLSSGYLPTLQVSGGSLALHSGTFYVGNRSKYEGRLLMDGDGAVSVAAELSMASASASTGTVAMSGSSRLDVAGILKMSAYAGCQSAIALTANANMTVGGEMQIGNASGSESGISLSGSANFVQTLAGDYVRLARAAGSRTTFHMGGDSTATFAGWITVGSGGAGSVGEMELEDNASLTITDTTGLSIGRYAGCVGSVHIGGNAELLLPGAHASTSGGICLSGSNNQYGDHRSTSSRLVMDGGRIIAPNAQLILCGTNSMVTLAGGETDFFRWWIRGDTNSVFSAGWVTPTNTILVTGGTHSLGWMDPGSELFVGESGTDARLDVRGGGVSLYKELTVGIGTTGRGSATFALSGTGRVEIKRRENDAVLAIASKSAMARARAELTGGELVASSIRGGLGVSELLADGVKFTLNGVDSTAAVRELTSATLGSNGLEIDTGIYNAAVAQAFADAPGADGLFVKSGDGSLRVDVASSHARTVVSNGTLTTALQFGRSVEVAPGAVLDITGTQGMTVETLSLGGAGSAEVATLVWDQAHPIEVTAANGLSLGRTGVALADETTTGAYPLFRVAGNVDAAVLDNLKIVNMDIARGYAFTASAEDGVTTVTLTISEVVVEDNVWTGADGSDWSAANFSSAPTATQRYVFPSDAVSKSVSVPAQGAVARGMTVAGDYSFGGGTLDLLGGISVSSGTATFGNDFSLLGDLAFDVAANSSLVLNGGLSGMFLNVTRTGLGSFVLGAANPDFLGTRSLAGGYHRFTDGAAFGPSAAQSVALVSGTLQYTGVAPGTVSRQVVLDAASDRSRVVVDAGAGLTLARGLHSATCGVVKTGGGALSIEYPAGTWNLGTGRDSENNGDNAIVNSLPANGSSPADASATSGAGLQILDGVLRVDGAGLEKTVVNQRQKTWIGTGYSAQSAVPALEIRNVTYNQGGASRPLVVGGSVASGKDNRSSLLVKDAIVKGNTLQLGNGTSVLYPSVGVTNATVEMIYEVTIGQTSDNVHPALRIGAGGVVRQKRPSGSATGIVLHRNVDVEVADGGVLETVKGNVDANCGVKFNADSFGRMRFADGGRLRTYMFTAANAPTQERHMDMVFDGGVLEMTLGGATSLGTSEHQVFTVEKGGMEVAIAGGIVHGFSTPFVGEGVVAKTGAGVMTILPCDVAGHDVIEAEGGLEVREGSVNLGGETISVSGIWGAGIVTNGTLAGTIVAKAGTTAADVLTLGDGLTARQRITAFVTADDPGSLEKRQVIPVAKVAGATVDISAWRCRVANKNLSAVLFVEDSVIYARLTAHRGFRMNFK